MSFEQNSGFREFRIDDRRCIRYDHISLNKTALEPENAGPGAVSRSGQHQPVGSQQDVQYILIQPVDDHDIEALPDEVRVMEAESDADFTLIAFKINDWNRELSPWEAPPVFGNESFSGGADETLQYLADSLMPWIRREVVEADPVTEYRWVIGGYSLAAFFALWVVTQPEMRSAEEWTNSDRPVFYGAAAASPSVWFPGWIPYLKEHPANTERVYLSLGDREPRTKNPIMKTVGDRIEETQEIMERDLGEGCCVFEWNKGNHFQKNGERTGRGFAEIMK